MKLVDDTPELDEPQIDFLQWYGQHADEMLLGHHPRSLRWQRESLNWTRGTDVDGEDYACVTARRKSIGPVQSV